MSTHQRAAEQPPDSALVEALARCRTTDAQAEADLDPAAELVALAARLNLPPALEPTLLELANLNLSHAELQKRPAELEATKTSLNLQLETLASGSSEGFIQSADAVKRVHAEIARVVRHLEALEKSLPRTAAETDSLLSAIDGAIKQRQKNTEALGMTAEVQQILEQPQLMDTCVRNGFIDDALELEEAARANAAVCSDVPLLADVSRQVSKQLAPLRDSLLAQLAGALALPDALRVVGYLRRMGSHAVVRKADALAPALGEVRFGARRGPPPDGGRFVFGRRSRSCAPPSCAAARCTLPRPRRRCRATPPHPTCSSMSTSAACTGASQRPLLTARLGELAS